MAVVTLQVVEGVDRGRVFRNVSTPVTIGREEGNSIRLSDERVSRFHAKVQEDNGKIILTDLASTNGTRVNNRVVEVTFLRPGDRISLGRSVLLFGSDEEISARVRSTGGTPPDSWLAGLEPRESSTVRSSPFGPVLNQDDMGFDLSQGIQSVEGKPHLGRQPLPPMPEKLSPAQVASLSEIFDLLHRAFSASIQDLTFSDDGDQVVVGFADWQKLQTIQTLLARYLRAVTDPDSLNE
ncbi:MAG: FHA domain-containing protein [Gemmataceae bacterium]|nr:FHA domain-containing protein [Gemmataceae bacterium]MDW8266944.1 FHA domain-containing protein [Gemmataceae bacterium]